MENDATEIGLKMNGLGLWEVVAPYNWAVKPRGTVFPYFCTVMKDSAGPVKFRFLMLEGWQTFHDFVRTRIDGSFGFCSSPMELPHFELVVLADGSVRNMRCDPGYQVRELTEPESLLVSKILWESYGVMIRIEADRSLALSYASQQAVFARVEDANGAWNDTPLAIPAPRPHVERITFAKADIAKAKDLPFAKESAIEVDFRLLPGVATVEPRPRCAYALGAIDSETGERIICTKTSVTRDGGLRKLWESMPARFLAELIARGRVPGEVKVSSARVFRMLRPLCVELPFKLSLHDSLPRLDADFRAMAAGS